jgi:hypothetical protein
VGYQFHINEICWPFIRLLEDWGVIGNWQQNNFKNCAQFNKKIKGDQAEVGDKTFKKSSIVK